MKLHRIDNMYCENYIFILFSNVYVTEDFSNLVKLEFHGK